MHSSTCVHVFMCVCLWDTICLDVSRLNVSSALVIQDPTTLRNVMSSAGELFYGR